MISLGKYVLLPLLFAYLVEGRRSLRTAHVHQQLGNGAGQTPGSALQTSGTSNVGGSFDHVGKGSSASKAHSMISTMVGAFLESKGPGIHDIIKRAGAHVDLTEALKVLEGELPNDVTSLVKMNTQAGSDAGSKALNETSIQRARVILNNMVFQSLIDIDDLIFDCKEFQERNRGTYEQVVNDIARLGNQLASFEEKRVSSNQCMSRQDMQIRMLQENLERITSEFNAVRNLNTVELTRRRNDLAVFEFILNATECPPEAAPGSLLQAHGTPGISVCSTNDGLQLNFDNEKLQTQVERMMTPNARLALRAALGQAQGQLSLFQARNFSTSVIDQGSHAVEQVPAQANWKKCTDITPSPDACGRVHDTLSIEWGKFRDEVDQLANDMTRNHAQFDVQRNNLNEQVTVATDSKTECQQQYAAATSSINAETEEQNEKLEQKHQLTTEYERMCAYFRVQITTKIHEEVCMVITVRSSVLSHSTTTTAENTVDCELGDWTSLSGMCVNPSGVTILCDDTCPRSDPNLCGGTETMRRDVLVLPSESGVQCGALTREKRCAQKKCPVDCAMSAWSGWSRCSRECEGGVQIQTRSVLTRPKNGGAGCDVVQTERACNTGSCDRDCSLQDWSDWAPCSQACTDFATGRNAAGWTSRSRSVLVPIRGRGKCPRPVSPERSDHRTCNTQTCAGDEFCIAQQDLVIALDASGSVRREGFGVLRKLATNLTERFSARHFGIDAMKVGAVLFGNGRLNRMADGTMTISEAIKVQNLTFDLATLRTNIGATTWQRGFTNMAQALALSGNIIARGGRDSAQSAVLVLSDGRPSFVIQTAQKAQALKDKNIKIFMVPVMKFGGPKLDVLKQWASHPWRTNYVRIPGLSALEFNSEVFVQQIIVKFCPDAVSPLLLAQQERAANFMMVHENGRPNSACAAASSEGLVNIKDDCATIARSKGYSAFSYGRDEVAGTCWTYPMQITAIYWTAYSANRTDPPCPGGGWDFNPYFDTFVISP